MIDIDVAVFTNLTLDHLDYHHTLDNYAAAKAKLFKQLDPRASSKKKLFPKTACINIDSPWAAKMMEGCPARVFTYSCEQKADLLAHSLQLRADGSHFRLNYLDKEYAVMTPLVGRYNMYNTLAALSVMIARGFKLEEIIPHLAQFKSVPGRLEPVPNPMGVKIFVDFAHSDDALINVLTCLKEFKKGRIITVFGCGGDRDKGKRPKMGQAAEEHSDLCIVTNDNPRSEDPEQIAKEILSGFKHPEKHLVELDRAAAIRKAIQLAGGEDIILIAGKGHETTQIFNHKTIEFDDRKVAFEIAQELSHS